MAAYRSGLALIRDVVGPEVYLVGCGAPLLPSVGLVDAMRVSPDTFHEGGEDGSAGLRGLMPLAARAWQQGRFWVNDPDCLVARPSYPLRERWADAVDGASAACGRFSDRVAELDEWGLRRLDACSPTAARQGPSRTGPPTGAAAARPLARVRRERRVSTAELARRSRRWSRSSIPSAREVCDRLVALAEPTPPGWAGAGSRARPTRRPS